MNAATAPPVNTCCFSPDGRYLIVGTGTGRLHIWSFPQAAAADDADAMPVPVTSVIAHGCAIYALVFAQTKSGLLLLSSADEEIRGWKWDALLAARGNKQSPVLHLINPQTALRRGGLGQLSETSALAIDEAAGRLYSAAGDGNSYAWDLAAGKCVETFAGVGEALHCLTLAKQRKQLVTGGEDGVVRLWDVRAGKCVQALNPTQPPLVPAESPHAPTAMAGAAGGSPSLGGAPVAPVSGSTTVTGSSATGSTGGGWCGCVGVDESEAWLVAGWGDGFLCTVDLNTYACVACLPTAAAPLAACFEPAVRLPPPVRRRGERPLPLDRHRRARDARYMQQPLSSGARRQPAAR